MDFSRFPRRVLPKDEVLFFEEEESRALYVLLTGALGIFRDEVQVAVVDQPLSIVGEMSALTRRPRNATVRALQPSTLVVVEEPDRLFEEYPQLGAKLARLLATRLSEMNAKFVELKHVLARSPRAGAARRGAGGRPFGRAAAGRRRAGAREPRRRGRGPVRPARLGPQPGAMHVSRQPLRSNPIALTSA
jgi:CRP-like cAMP-binding protein